MLLIFLGYFWVALSLCRWVAAVTAAVRKNRNDLLKEEVSLDSSVLIVCSIAKIFPVTVSTKDPPSMRSFGKYEDCHIK